MDVQLAPTGTYINVLITVYMAIGIMIGFVMAIPGYLSRVMTSLLGPLMGTSSVLWFVMRNDEAVKPRFAWIVFGIWSAVYLMYLIIQTTKVAYDKLYILLALAFGGVCLFIVALVQKASIQGGLVTAIPPCASFAAYAIAFCFPARRRAVHLTAA
ncbi:hypothetical protein IQ06DRAFT_292524 [Phaeosphaeriaceae sp. SRC1lsM3a]|nr:hypothetical protein IQ06DRAFT_292524 [Stagonospora sp. SRC1lsM3a]